MGFEWLDWLGGLVKLVGDLIPQREKVDPTLRAVLFRNMTKIIVLPAGIYWYWPWTSEIISMPVKRQVITIGQQDVTTADNMPVKFGGMVSYEIGPTDDEIIRAFVECYLAEDSIDDEATSVFCSVIKTKTFAEIQQNPDDTNTELTRKVRSRLREYGLRTHRAQLTSFATGLPLLHIGGNYGATYPGASVET